MKKALLTFIALMGLTAAQAQTPVKAWYKTWITPEKCVTGITEITYDATSDCYTVKDGLAGDSGTPFYFNFVSQSDGGELLGIYASIYDYTAAKWLDAAWYSNDSYIGMYLYSETYEYTDICCGQYYSLGGSKPGEGKGALYLYSDACDTDGQVYTYNFYCQPSLVWPAEEPVKKVSGTFKNGMSPKSQTCEMWVYANGVHVIKAYNGIAGYDIAFDPATNSIQSDNFIPGLFNPESYPDYTFRVYERMANDNTNNIAKVMNVKKVEAFDGKVEFTYDYADYNIDKGQDSIVTKTNVKATFTCDAITGIAKTVSLPTQDPAQYYNVGGARVAAPGRGIVLRRQGNKVVKIAR